MSVCGQNIFPMNHGGGAYKLPQRKIGLRALDYFFLPSGYFLVQTQSETCFWCMGLGQLVVNCQFNENPVVHLVLLEVLVKIYRKLRPYSIGLKQHQSVMVNNISRACCITCLFCQIVSQGDATSQKEGLTKKVGPGISFVI